MPDSSNLMFEADTALVDRVVYSPNFGARKGDVKPDMIILHYTGMKSGAEALERLCDPQAEVSSHYFVEENGSILQLVAEDQRAWHAGNSFWQGRRDINSLSIGIEIVNPGHEHGYRPFPQVQMDAVLRLLIDICGRQKIRQEFVLAHSDIAPSRKEDPGELFGWKQLADENIGIWVEAAPIVAGAELCAGDSGAQIIELQGKLSALGFEIEQTGIFDDVTLGCVTAFQRHFRPELISGIADPSTLDTLQRLLEKLKTGV